MNGTERSKRDAEIIELARRGATRPQLARRFDLSTSRICHILAEAGLTKPQPKYGDGCGTIYGYQLHRDRGEEVCEKCQIARRNYHKGYTAGRRERAGQS